MVAGSSSREGGTGAPAISAAKRAGYFFPACWASTASQSWNHCSKVPA